LENRKKQGRAIPAPTAAKLTALAALEASRHASLCQLLEHSMGNWCDDYLRQLATNAVRVSAVSEIAAMQAELLKHREPPAKAQPAATATRKTASGTAKHETDVSRKRRRDL
jgi:hypothetical protein